MMRLRDKAAVVTGASRSIGRAIAVRLAREGADVAVGYRSHEAQAEETAAEIEKTGRAALTVRADVSTPAGAERLTAAAVDRFGRIDILVNNAGVLQRTPFFEITEREWDRIMDVNLKGYFLCAQAAARIMAERESGVIINISSVCEQLAGVDLTHYGCAKGGVRMLTRQLALELAPYGIRANGIAPGLIETDLNRDDIADPEFRDYRLSLIPLKTIGVPEDVAGAAAFLASDESRLATGSTIFLDAGQSIT